MKHRNTVMVAACLLLFANHIYAEIKQKLTVNAATVFLSGASLTSTAKLELAKGEQEILFTNVAPNVNTSSIIVNATNGVIVEGTIFQNSYIAPEVLSRRSREINDSIALLTDSREPIGVKIDAIDEQLTVLQNNRKVSSEKNGLSVDELAKMLDLIGARMDAYANERNRQASLLKKTDEHIARLRQEFDEEQRKGATTGGRLLVKFYAQDAGSSTITVTYVVPNAGWSPAYDIMADAVNAPIKLYYKANVYQNSGIKWDNVALSLSTGNPTESMQAPVINPWYLSLYIPAPAYAQNPSSSKGLSEITVTAYKKPLIDADRPSSHVYSREDLSSTTAGVYQSQHGSDLAMSRPHVLESTDAYNVQAASSITNHTAVNNVGVNAIFDIDLPYTIPSDGQQHIVAIKKYEMPATYRYYAAPKLDKDAFLQAQVTDWEDMNLLPGPTNIFYENAYIGQGNISINNPSDTMIISLGRDKKIVIKRERDKTLRSVKTIGTNVRETFAYTITVRNMRKEKINLIMQDQVPVSNDKDIVVEDLDTADSDYTESTGLMNWTLTPGAGETKKLSFGFTIKYPKGGNITGLR